MARARKSHAGDEEKTNRGGIEPPYSGKVGGNRYCIYCVRVRDEKVINTLIWNFSAKHAAKWFLEKIIGNHTWVDGEYGNKPAFVCDNGVIVAMPGEGVLQEISDYVRPDAEREWGDLVLEPYIRTFLYGQEPTGRRDDLPLHAPINKDGADEADRGSDAEPESKRKRGRKHRVSDDRLQPNRTKVAKPDGLVTAVDLGAQLKLIPREVRAALRAIGEVKPAHGWSWTKEEAESIAEKVTAFLKKKGKK